MENATANRIELVGRVTREPVERELPSGDRVVTFRISVARPVGGPSKARSDWFDCAVWTGRLRRNVARWQVGDVVSVTGGLRRRVFRGSAGFQSFVEVEVETAQRLRRVLSGES